MITDNLICNKDKDHFPKVQVGLSNSAITSLHELKMYNKFYTTLASRHIYTILGLGDSINFNVRTIVSQCSQ